MENKIKIIEKICIIGIVILAVIIAAGASVVFLRSSNKAEADTKGAEVGSSGDALAEMIDYLPDSVYYGMKLPITEFQAADGSTRSLSEYKGKKLILMFWGSWCNYCDEVLSHSEEYEAVLKDSDYEFLLINKLDPKKGETVKKAERYLQQNHIPFESLYDPGLIAYDAFGLKLIPTLLVLDEGGYLRYMTVSTMKSGEELSEILDYVNSGGAAATLSFVKESMTGKDGGIYTSYTDKKGEHPIGRDVLSESQGIMMEYAVLTDDRELFDRSWQYAKDKMYNSGVFSWYVTEGGDQAQANALLDDLRIYKALKNANQLWGGYGTDVRGLAESIRIRNITGGRLVGFYDFNQKISGSSLPLFYIDLEALEDFPNVKSEAEKILRGGYISDEFPLYYSYYDRQSGKYNRDSMNTAESLMTLYHAVKAGVANQSSIDWLEEKVMSGTLAARYEVTGKSVSRYEYDSTSVYAIAALIGGEAGNARLYTAARNRMEKYYVTDNDGLRGAFSDKKDGSDITAFDQLMPLLVYVRTKDIVF